MVRRQSLVRPPGEINQLGTSFQGLKSLATGVHPVSEKTLRSSTCSRGYGHEKTQKCAKTTDCFERWKIDQSAQVEGIDIRSGC